MFMVDGQLYCDYSYINTGERDGGRVVERAGRRDTVRCVYERHWEVWNCCLTSSHRPEPAPGYSTSSQHHIGHLPLLNFDVVYILQLFIFSNVILNYIKVEFMNIFLEPK
ncbi:hypothetical protein OTU49_005440, partial [Cherax quadricarinatus]